MSVGAGLYMCDLVKKFTFAISSPDEFLLHSSQQKLVIHYNALPLSPTKLPLRMGGIRTPCYVSLDHPHSASQTASQSAQQFLQGSQLWQTRLNEQLFVQHGCQTVFVKPVVQPGLITGWTTLAVRSTRLSNRFDNRLYRVNGV